MEWVETTGRTVTEALETALDRLGVDEQEAEIQILEEPQTGLFGRLKVEARVRARVRPTAPRAKPERRTRRRRNEGGDRKRKKSPNQRKSSGPSTPPAAATAPKSGQAVSSTESDGREDSEGRTSDGEASPAATQGSAGTQGQRSSSSRRRRRRKSGGGGSQQGANVTTQQQTEGQDEDDAGASVEIEPQKEAVDEFLTGLLTALGRTEASVSTAATEGDTIVAEIDGDELGLLVGPKGQTLQAVHELTRSVVQRRFVGQSHARLELDVAGYRKRRAEALARFTRELADEVLDSGEAKALEPMSASDRKVVHDVVNEIDGIRTFSEGEDLERHVVIDVD